ncbi:MAG: tetratricopeptide repeat protein [Chthoniobacterales bacterium]|nr:tetratricopeptide repeat protein [Chthoniobacterales bacterium]
MRALSLIFAIWLGLTTSSFAAPAATGNAETTFAKANADYATGHFPAAIKGYEALVASRQWNPTLFYDLGNAYFRTGDSGRAILNYERALALDQNHAEARANLQLVRDQARALELAPVWVESRLGFLTRSQYSWLAAAAFWGAAAIFCGLYFARRRAVVWIFALLLLGAISATAAFAVYQLETGSAGADLAIVTKGNTQARLATAETSGTVLVLPPGSEIKILSTRGDWSYAALPNDLRGWIPAQSAERVRL